MLLVIVIVVLFIVIIIFASPTISPIPYFPSNKKDLPLILKGLDLKNDHIIYDLGAGDGAVIFAAAKYAYEKKLNTRFIATEINPILLSTMHLRKLFHPNKKNIKVIYANMFSMNFSNEARCRIVPGETMEQWSNITIYLYISPWYLEKTLANIKKHLHHFKIVSYMYPIKSLEKKEPKTLQGVHKVFVYNVYLK